MSVSGSALLTGSAWECSRARPCPKDVWFNTPRMHVWTHLKPSAQGRTGIGLYPDGMVEHDDMVGALLKEMESLPAPSN